MKFNRKYVQVPCHTKQRRVCVLVLRGLTLLMKGKEEMMGGEGERKGKEREKEGEESWYPHLLYESHAPANEILVSKRTIVWPLTTQ